VNKGYGAILSRHHVNMCQKQCRALLRIANSALGFTPWRGL
jgi:hypothetical protein